MALPIRPDIPDAGYDPSEDEHPRTYRPPLEQSQDENPIALPGLPSYGGPPIPQEARLPLNGMSLGGLLSLVQGRGGPQAPPTPEAIAGGAKPAVPQVGGGVSTEKSIGIEMDGKHYVIPTIVDGVSLTPDAAVEAFRAGKIQPLGVFGSQKEADAFAEQRSRELDKAFGGKGELKKGPSAPADGRLMPQLPGPDKTMIDRVMRWLMEHTQQ